MTKKKTMCLNMIVKDESAIIVDSLEKLLSHIKFNYWVICDTGSSDSTKTLIRDFFKARKIPGELIETPWQDFGYNRTIALQNAYKKGDYVLIWDADDYIEGNFTLPTCMDSDAYSLTFANNQTNITYSRPVLLNNHIQWKFVGVLHEYLAYVNTDLSPPNNLYSGKYTIHSGRSGARNQDPLKFIKDAGILERALISTNPNSSLYGRYLFYCGNSYFNAGKYDECLPYYIKTLESSTWSQEKFVSCLRIYEAYEKNNQGTNGLIYLEKAFEYDPCRIECIFRLIRYYCVQRNNEKCFMLYALIQDWYETTFLQDKLESKLFAYTIDYNYNLPYFMIIVAERSRKYDVGVKMYEMIFQKGDITPNDWHMNNLFFNLQFFIDAFKTKNEEYKTKFMNLMFEYINSLHHHNKYILEPTSISIIQSVVDECRIGLYKENKIKKELKSVKCDTIFTITSCKRPHLFKQTMNSILNTWLDITLIDKFFCVDDGTENNELENIKTIYPFMTFLEKQPGTKGHRGSMNLIWKVLTELKPKYWIHMEDDWLFFKQENYVQKSIEFLNLHKSNNIHQILYNRHYAETLEEWCLEGGEALQQKEYLLHAKKDGMQGKNCGYWPHYSFRPSMVRVEVIVGLGNYDSVNTFFENDYAKRYYDKGYLSAFFNSVNCIHIGKLTNEKGDNAYSLNEIEQFQPTKTFLFNSLQFDTNESLISSFKNLCKIKQIHNLDLEPTQEVFDLFRYNNFGNKKEYIVRAYNHYNMWKTLLNDAENNYYILIENYVSALDNNMKLEFGEFISLFEKSSCDICFLGHEMLHKFMAQRFHRLDEAAVQIVPFDRKKYAEKTFAYCISKKGAKKLLDYVSKNGIKYKLDALFTNVESLSLYNSQPHLFYVNSNIKTEDNICSFFDFSKFYKTESSELNATLKTVIIYHVKDFNKNFLWFLKHGLLRSNVDYVFVSERNNAMIPNWTNIRVLTEESFTNYSILLKDINYIAYDFFVFLNSDIYGPNLPEYFPKTMHWSEIFTKKINSSVKFITTEIECIKNRDAVFQKNKNCFFATDKIGIQLLMLLENAQNEFPATPQQFIKFLFHNGYTVDSLQTVVKDLLFYNPTMQEIQCNNPYKLVFYTQIEEQLPKKIRIIVSLTTTPKRLPLLKPILDSLLNQSYSPERVILNLPEIDEPYIIPDWIHECSEKLFVNRCPLTPIVKLLPSVDKFDEHDDVWIATAEDNINALPHTLEIYKQVIETGDCKIAMGLIGKNADDSLFKTVDALDKIGMPLYHLSFFKGFREQLKDSIENEDLHICNWLTSKNIEKKQVGSPWCNKTLLMKSVIDW